MNPIELETSLEENDFTYDIELSEEIRPGGGTNDYQKLINLPTINGTELFDNYDEIDPTVPEWAKESTKPSYTAEEVGAIGEDSEMSFTDVKAIWDSVFNQGG